MRRRRRRAPDPGVVRRHGVDLGWARGGLGRPRAENSRHRRRRPGASYDKLVVAIGGARRCACRRLSAAPTWRALRAGQRGRAGALDAPWRPAKAAVVGGGYIGLEAAAACARAPGPPHCMLMEPHTMARLVDARGGGQVRGPVRVQGRGVPPRRQGEARGRRRRRARRGGGAGGRRRFAPSTSWWSARPGAPSGPSRARCAPPPIAKRPGGIAVDHVFAASGAGVAPRVRLRRRRRRRVPGARRVSAAPSPTRVEHVAHARASAAHCARACLTTPSTRPTSTRPSSTAACSSRRTSSRAVRR